MKRLAKQYFSQKRLTRGAGIVVGLGAGAFGKQLLLRQVTNEWIARLYGLLGIVVGATINMKVKHPAAKAAGTGMVSYGILDLLVSNIAPLADFLPQISGPAFGMSAPAIEEVEGGMGYGRSMGANLSVNSNEVEVVGANLSTYSDPEVVGDDDLMDAIDNYL